MELQTKRLILREYTHADFDALYEILSDAETMKHYEEPYDSDGVHLWIEWNLESYEDFGFGLWAVLLKGQNDENNTFIGDCGITMQRIGRWIRPEIAENFPRKSAVISTKNITEWALLPKRHAAAAIIFSKTRRSTLSIPT